MLAQLSKHPCVWLEIFMADWKKRRAGFRNSQPKNLPFESIKKLAANVGFNARGRAGGGREVAPHLLAPVSSVWKLSHSTNPQRQMRTTLLNRECLVQNPTHCFLLICPHQLAAASATRRTQVFLLIVNYPSIVLRPHRDLLPYDPALSSRDWFIIVAHTIIRVPTVFWYQLPVAKK